MTIATTRELVERAQNSGSAVLAFNVITLEYAEGIVAGAERAGAAVILQLSERAIGYHGEAIAPLLGACRSLAEGAAVPIALHLDHIEDQALIARALEADHGATSIMLDFSREPHDENVRLTRHFTELAHARGLWVEAELGEIGGKDGAHAPGVRTDAAEAREFVSRTGVDGLAVAVGSSHAMTSQDALLDTTLIEQLAAAVPVPLVLHGSSGVADAMLIEAVTAGIRKVNVGTALSLAFTGAVRSFVEREPATSDPRRYLGAGRDALASAVERLCRVIGALSEAPHATEADASSDPLWNTIRQHKAGRSVGIYSVCSAHPTVLEASLLQAKADDSYVLIEATSNQVDQFGGYTGMRPSDFREFVFDIAARVDFPRERIVLGGDHLGPNRWQKQPAEEAMQNADALVAAYVQAGYTKIHLDCSMSCADDPVPAGDELVAERTARLMRIAEDTAREAGLGESILYVIGTEVPVPGGAHETLSKLTPTSPEAARTTLEQHRIALAERGLDAVWPRIIALVVQPAVEFDHLQVIDYVHEATAELRAVLGTEPGMVFEAHSTDYQRPTELRQLVEDDWAILKVGPGLTFAMREALFALAKIEDELLPEHSRSRLIEVIDDRMVAEPGYWQNYYEGSPDEQRIARRYSYSDRLRYYWPDEQIVAAEARLYENLAAIEIPLPLISQYLPEQYTRVRAGELAPDPRSLVIDRVRDCLRPYAVACFPELSQPSDTHQGARLV